MYGDDTIAAIASGVGEAAIGVVRVSGPNAMEIGTKVFKPKRGRALSARASHTVTYGWIVDRMDTVIDEGLAVVMRGPRSFTGEDVVEFHCHGGRVAVERVLAASLRAGARLAEPGEFTRRAFLKGRMDLSQAEAVIDIIRAKTDRAMIAAVNQLRGELSHSVGVIRGRLLEAIAHLEADIDFPELELEVQTKEQVLETCRWGSMEVQSLLRRARQGKIMRDGLRVVLAGRPNVGKSSLMNRLARENRSIVTEIPGTTRDVVEEWVNIRGVPVVLADTAGIRHTADRLEQLGVDRSRETLQRADLVAVVFDASTGITDEDREIVELLPSDTLRIGVINKSDLTNEPYSQAAAELLGAPVVEVSAHTGVGLDTLEEVLAATAVGIDVEEGALVNARHEECLQRALSHLMAAERTGMEGFGSDLISIDVRAAWLAMGEILGETVDDDLLDQIFSRFCIGK